jgi:hypothetical protein
MNEYSCPDCGREFQSRSGRNRHRQHIHARRPLTKPKPLSVLALEGKLRLLGEFLADSLSVRPNAHDTEEMRVWSRDHNQLVTRQAQLLAQLKEVNA